MVKCPHCDQAILSVEAQDIDITVQLRPQWQGLVYVCPRCHKVLSVGVNPMILRSETVNQTVSRIAQLLDGLLARIVDLFRRP